MHLLRLDLICWARRHAFSDLRLCHFDRRLHYASVRARGTVPRVMTLPPDGPIARSADAVMTHAPEEPVLYILIRGAVTVVSDGVAAAELAPGDAFNEDALLEPPTSDAAGGRPPGPAFVFVAAEDTDLAVVPAAAFQRFVPREGVFYAPLALRRYTERAEDADGAADGGLRAIAAAEFFGRGLARLSVFAGLPRAARCDLAREVCLITAGKGAVLRREGEPMIAHFAVVMRGSLDVRLSGAGAQRAPASAAAAAASSSDSDEDDDHRGKAAAAAAAATAPGSTTSVLPGGDAASGGLSSVGAAAAVPGAAAGPEASAAAVDAAAEAATRVTRRRSFVVPASLMPSEPLHTAGQLRNPGAPALYAVAAAGAHPSASLVGSASVGKLVRGDCFGEASFVLEDAAADLAEAARRMKLSAARAPEAEVWRRLPAVETFTILVEEGPAALLVVSRAAYQRVLQPDCFRFVRCHCCCGICAVVAAAAAAAALRCSSHRAPPPQLVRPFSTTTRMVVRLPPESRSLSLLAHAATSLPATSPFLAGIPTLYRDPICEILRCTHYPGAWVP